MASVTLDEVKAFAEENGLIVESIENTEFGSSHRIKAIQLKTNVGSALFPRKGLNNIEFYKRAIAPNQNYENFWNSVDWFMPPYVSMGTIGNAINNAGINVQEHSYWDKRDLQSRFEPFLSSIYTLGNIISITVQTLSDSTAISKHLPIIKESILAFYSGMKVAAIAFLINVSRM